MQWDLGVAGVGLLMLMSLAAGVVTRLVWGRSAVKQLWLIASGVYFVLGVLISEFWFGWATQEELQPNIDGLSFDEVLVGFLLMLFAVATARLITRRRRHRLT